MAAMIGPQNLPAGSIPIVNPTGGSDFFGGGTSRFLKGAGGILGGIGDFIQSEGFAQYNAASATAARALGVEAPKKAAWEITRLRIEKRSVLSSQRFSAALAGIQLEGTPVDIMQLTEREFLLDEENIWREGQIDKFTYEEQAKAYDKAEKANKRSGIGSVLGTVISVIGGH
jgi:hypothetical protein